MKTYLFAFFLLQSSHAFAAGRPSLSLPVSERTASRPADIQVKPRSQQSFFGFRNTRLDPTTRHIQNETEQLRDPSASFDSQAVTP